MPLGNCRIKFDLTWSKNCVISEISRTPEMSGNNSVDAIQATEATFKLNSTELFAPVVTLSINDNIKFLENKKERFKIIISWSNYRCETIRQIKSSNLHYMIIPTFWNIKRTFVLTFKNPDNNLGRNSYDKYYMSFAKINDFNALIDNKTLFHQPVKNKPEPYEKLAEMSKMVILQQETY